MLKVNNPTLRISEDLVLPLDIVVESTAIIGKRGRGKTFTAKRVVEEVLRQGVTVLVIDPTDVWWGLRSGADGSERGGLDVLVIGGKRGDLPAHPGSGKMLARLALDGTSVVLVLKGLPKAERRRLAGETLTELYDRSEGKPILVVIDEADEFAPEGVRSIGNRRDDPLVLAQGAVEDIVRRGRAGGLGSLLITQRVAVLSKNVLEQSDTLIALGVTGKNDIDAVTGWISKHARDTAQGREITDSLPGLPRGTAWVWAPEYGVLHRTEVLPISTYDSSRSPRVGEVIVEPKGRKSIDLAALGVEMERFAEQVKADDPNELRKQLAGARAQITELERDLSAYEIELGKAQEAAARVAEPVEVPMPLLEEELLDKFEGLLSAAAQVGSELAKRWQETLDAVDGARSAALAQSVPRSATPERATKPQQRATQPRNVARSDKPKRAPVVATGDPDPRIAGDGAPRRILIALATAGLRLPDRVVASRAGVARSKSTWRNAMSRLRAWGYIEGSSELTITPEGLGALGGYEPLPTGRALCDYWLSDLGATPARLLRELLDAYPDPLSPDEMCARAQVDRTLSTYRNAMSKLRGLDLVTTTRDSVYVNDELGKAWRS